MSGYSILPYKNAIIREVGNTALYEDQINELGRRMFGPRWGGVYPSDKMPKTQHNKFYVVNTNESSGGGIHWLGIYSSQAGRIYVYDSYARPVTKLIRKAVKNILKKHIVEEANQLPDQRDSEVCGHLSLAWLCLVRDAGIRRALEGVADITAYRYKKRLPD